MGKAATLRPKDAILIGGTHWVTINQIDSGGKNVKLYVESPGTIRFGPESELRKSENVTDSKT